MLAALAALTLNLAIAPNGVLVLDKNVPSGVTGATRAASGPPPHRAPPPPGSGRRCIVPANLPSDPSIEYHTAPGEVSADLPGPHFALPRKIDLSLAARLKPPAPNASEIYLGDAQIDTRTGGVSIDGADLSAAPIDCP